MSTLVVTPETVQVACETQDDEVYARSLAGLRLWGGYLAVRASLAEGTVLPEDFLEAERAAEQIARDEWLSAVFENTGSSAEASQLDAQWFRARRIENGHVVAADGTPIVDIVRRGIAASQKEAQSNSAFKAQAQRDWYDLEVANTADGLRFGESLIVLSLEPREALAAHPREYQDLGYRLGESRIQIYSRYEDGLALAGSIAVNDSDPEAWRQLLAEKFGIAIPDGLSSDEWIRYGARLHMEPDEVIEAGLQLRLDYYKAIGLSHHRLSVSEFVDAHQSLVDAYMRCYLEPLARAIYTGRNEPTLQGLAATIAATPSFHRLRAVHDGISQTITANDFTPDMARAMEQAIRYGLLEGMHDQLVVALQRGAVTPTDQPDWFAKMPAATLDQWVAGNIQAGVAAGRTYGGCAGINLANDEFGSANLYSPMDAYGRASAASSENDTVAPTIIKCIKCRRPSPRQAVVHKDYWRCPHCRYQVDVCTGRVMHQQIKPEADTSTSATTVPPKLGRTAVAA